MPRIKLVKPKFPPGVTEADGKISFPPFVFRGLRSDEDPESWKAECRAAWNKQKAIYEHFVRAYERWCPDSKYNRDRRARGSGTSGTRADV